MTAYAAPLLDIRFMLKEIAGYDAVAALPGYEEASWDLAEAALVGSAKLSDEVLAPLNRTGDIEGAKVENGVVRTASGWRDAYAAFRDGGWNALPFEPEHGGQGLPWLLCFATQEMWQAANMSFALCPLLTQGAVELLSAHGSPAQKATYLPQMISGHWTGTMNLTEPQAGTDLGAVKTRAVPGPDGTWRITGQKIYITYGEHDLAPNIVHMVLARLPDAPAGSKGISLFIVPKFLVRSDGSLGQRNDLRCVSLEHKLGINASPTCVMSYGDGGGATGYLVGEANRGLEYMFTMMNTERLGVGIQGLAIAERAYQGARAYALQRVQSRGPRGAGAPIVQHPDVRRMLLSMKARIDAMRGLVYAVGAAIDRSKKAEDLAERRAASEEVEVLTPVAKAWCTDLGCEIASTGIQVFGGMGFVEETGAAQHYRDARITPIYEGTNGVQALDLVGRKLLRDGGGMARRVLARMAVPDGAPADMRAALGRGMENLAAATEWLLKTGPAQLELAQAGATPYLKLFGHVAGGWFLARAAAAASNGADWPDAFKAGKQLGASFYAHHVLPETGALLHTVKHGGESVLAIGDASF
ncbi:MAG: acyl-CoA dehydrogenase [Alphaproteobacteria bacterium]|nr:acyl-CoA dehydrogenase [Alphaproteobacteria bacterium]